MISFVVLRLGRTIAGPVSGARALSAAWNTTVSSPGAQTLIAPVHGRPVMVLEWKRDRVDCRPLPSGPRLTYSRAADMLEKSEKEGG